MQLQSNQLGQKDRFTFREAAAYLGIGYSTLRRRVAQKEIGVCRLSRSRNWIFRAELDAFIRSKSTSRFTPI